jgi:hypothetical protein
LEGDKSPCTREWCSGKKERGKERESRVRKDDREKTRKQEWSASHQEERTAPKVRGSVKKRLQEETLGRRKGSMEGCAVDERKKMILPIMDIGQDDHGKGEGRGA